MLGLGCAQSVARATRNIEPHEQFPSSPGATICLGQYDCSEGMCSVHLLFSKWYKDFVLVWQIQMCIRIMIRNAYILHKKPHTHTRTNSLDQSVPSSIPQFMDCLREETGAESSCPRLRCFMTLTWGQKHKEWVGRVWRIRMVLWAFCLRSSQNREATGWKSKSAVLEADLTICSRWVFSPLSRYTVVPDKVEETKDAFNDRMIETGPWAPYFMPLFLKCLRKWSLFTVDNDLSFQLR